jgi:hypothetical protein
MARLSYRAFAANGTGGGRPVQAAPRALCCTRNGEGFMSRDEHGSGGESKRILDRLAKEADGGRSADPETDWIELWGTRIGRSLGVVIFAGLVLWLVFVVLPRS